MSPESNVTLLNSTHDSASEEEDTLTFKVETRVIRIENITIEEEISIFKENFIETLPSFTNTLLGILQAATNFSNSTLSDFLPSFSIDIYKPIEEKNQTLDKRSKNQADYVYLYIGLGAGCFLILMIVAHRLLLRARNRKMKLFDSSQLPKLINPDPWELSDSPPNKDLNEDRDKLYIGGIGQKSNDGCIDVRGPRLEDSENSDSIKRQTISRPPRSAYDGCDWGLERVGEKENSADGRKDLRRKHITISRDYESESDDDSSESDEFQNSIQNGHYPSFLDYDPRMEKVNSKSGGSRVCEQHQSSKSITISEHHPNIRSTDNEDSKSYKIDIKEKETHLTDSTSVNNNSANVVNGIFDLTDWRFWTIEWRESSENKTRRNDIKIEDVTEVQNP